MSRRESIVVCTEPLAPVAERWARQRFDLRVCAPGDAEWSEALAVARGLVVRTATRVDAGLLAIAQRLRVVGRAGVGLDNVDVAACRRRGVEVVYTPDANTQAVVEYVVRMVLEVLRPTCDLAEAVDGKARAGCAARRTAGASWAA